MFHNGRCGSTVLGEMLGKHALILWDGEVFIGPNAAQSGFKPQHQWNRSPHYPAYPFRYLRDRVRQTTKEWYGFEIQSYQLGEIKVPLKSFVGRLARNGFHRFILLERKNYLRVVTSNLLALQKSKFTLPAGDSPEFRTIRINIDHVYPRSRSLLHLFQWFDRTFLNLRTQLEGKAVLELNYEEHILESPLVAHQKVCAFIGVEPGNPPVKLGRTTPWPLRDVIENYDEVVAALRGTPYEWMTSET